jgi:hypothetical protein
MYRIPVMATAALNSTSVLNCGLPPVSTMTRSFALEPHELSEFCRQHGQHRLSLIGRIITGQQDLKVIATTRRRPWRPFRFSVGTGKSFQDRIGQELSVVRSTTNSCHCLLSPTCLLQGLVESSGRTRTQADLQGRWYRYNYRN